MAKNTANGPSFNEHELNDPDPPLVIRRFQLGDDTSSVGANSPLSGQSESWSSAGETAGPQSPAQTTENPSGKPPQGEDISTVHSTDGNGPETEVPPYDEWSNSDLKEECRKRGLPVSGNHDALVERLTEDDAEQAEIEEEASTEDDF